MFLNATNRISLLTIRNLIMSCNRNFGTSMDSKHSTLGLQLHFSVTCPEQCWLPPQAGGKKAAEVLKENIRFSREQNHHDWLRLIIFRFEWILRCPCDRDKRKAIEMSIRKAKEESRVPSRVTVLPWGQCIYLAHSGTEWFLIKHIVWWLIMMNSPYPSGTSSKF